MMNYFYACLLLGTTLQMVTSQVATPEITFISPKQTGEIGGSVSLECSAKNAQDTPLLWLKKGESDNVYISSGSALLIPDSRYSIRHNATSWTYTLKIDRLVSSDAGVYQCALSLGPGNLPTVDVELQVR